jgi:hypothetical protein
MDFDAQAHAGVLVTVSSVLSWNVSSAPAWITAIKDSSTALSIDVEENTGEPRSGAVVLTNGASTVSLTVTQDGTASPGGLILELVVDGTVRSDQEKIIMDNMPIYIPVTGMLWMFNDPLTGELFGLEASPVAADVPWHTLSMVVRVDTLASPGTLLSLPIGPGRRLKIFATSPTSIMAMVYQDGITVGSNTVTVSSNTLGVIVARGVDDGRMHVIAGGGEIYAEDLTGPWFIGNAPETRLYAGLDFSGLPDSSPAFGVHVGSIVLS